MKYRANDYTRVSNLMLLRLTANDIGHEERLRLIQTIRASNHDTGVPWGSPRRTIRDVLSIVNDRRARDGRPAMEETELREAISLYISGQRKNPLVEELTDALGNLREARLGFREPLFDSLRKTA
ncbi:MAG: hypothetical protein AB1324_03795 [Candidatus Micrarchaeota archaeon]